MTRLLILLLLPCAGFAQLAGPYGTEHTVYLNFLDTDGTDLTGEVDGGTEVTLSCDGAAGATATNDFGADTNTGGWYPLTLTAAEMQCASLNIQVAASVDQSYTLETYGNASAQHPDMSVLAQVEDQDGGYTLKCAVATLLAFAAGELSTTAGVSTYQDPGGNETRVVGTVTTNGNRGSITVTCP